MKKLFAAGIALLAVTGCAGQNGDGPTSRKDITAPCEIADGSKYITQSPRVAEHPPSRGDIPEKGQQAQVNGCASFEYQIDKHGKPKNARVLVEYPKGYDFGKTAVAQLKKTTFEAPSKPDQWYWTISSWHLGK